MPVIPLNMPVSLQGVPLQATGRYNNSRLSWEPAIVYGYKKSNYSAIISSITPAISSALGLEK